jgi:hypothetical protein
MKTLLIPALGIAAAFGAAQPAGADVQLSQLMIQGQPGYTGTVNRTPTPGSPGITPMNTPVGPSPFAVGPSPSFRPQAPFVGQRGELNVPEHEYALPGEPDASGKIGPTVDRQRARFAGERGSDGKLLPTYSPELRAQATQPSTAPQAAPPTPAPTDVQRRPGSGAMTTPSQPSGQAQTGPSGTTGRSMQQSQTTQQRQMQSDRQRSGSTQPRMGSRGQQEMSETAALNALSAEGYTNVGKIERVGNAWQTTAMKEGKQVTVQIDPQTHRIMPR